MGCVRRDFSTLMLLLTMASIPLARSYRPHVIPGTTVTMAQENKTTHGIEEAKKSDGGSVGLSLSEYEESARLVPTGPDPLHHNHNPIKPIIKS